jgi:hypothetical protein
MALTNDEILERAQEIVNRGLVDQLPPEKQEMLQEMIRRGLVVDTRAAAATPAARQPDNVDATLGALEQAVTNPLDTLSAAATVASSVAGEAVGGVAGILAATGTKFGQFMGLTDQDASAVGTDVINSVRDTMRINPSAGAQEILGKVAEIPAIRTLSELSEEGSEASAELFADVGRAVGGEDGAAYGHAFGKGLATAGEMAIGGVIGKGTKAASNLTRDIAKGSVDAVKEVRAAKNLARETDLQVDQALAEVDLTSEGVFKRASDMYKKIEDESNFKIKNSVVQKTFDKIQKDLEKEGFNINEGQTASQLRAVDKMINEGKNFSITDLDNQRRRFSEISSSIDRSEASKAVAAVQKIDDLMDRLEVDPVIGDKYKLARKTHQKALKLKEIETAFKIADRDVGTLKTEMKRIIRGETRAEGKRRPTKYSESEIDIMREIAKGEGSPIVTALLKLDTESSSPMNANLQLLITGGLGASVGGLGGAAATLLLGKSLGSVARKSVSKQVARNADNLRGYIVAGNDAKAIVKQYLKTTPVKDRNVEDLTSILMNPEVRNISSVRPVDSKTRKAIDAAKKVHNRVAELRKSEYLRSLFDAENTDALVGAALTQSGAINSQAEEQQ